MGETLERKDYKDNSYTLSLALSGDEHDLPLIMTKQILEIKGIPVINCGRNTPANSIKRLLKKFQPDKIIVSLTIYIEDKKLAKQELDDLLKNRFKRLTRKFMLVEQVFSILMDNSLKTSNCFIL